MTIASVLDNPSVVITYTQGITTAVAVSLRPTWLIEDGSSTASVTATATDVSDTRKAGDTVAFTADDPGVRFGAVTDHGDGTYTATLTSSTTAHLVTLTAPTAPRPRPCEAPTPSPSPPDR